MQLHYLQHSEIDKQRWLQAIRQSNNGLIYAWPQYLDAISPGWHALMADDYNLVMPLTHRSKWGTRYLYQPPFCQQLGVFGTVEMSVAIVSSFISAVKQKFRFAEINLNYTNQFSEDKLFFRNNYVMDLSDHYTTLQSRYRHEVVRKDLNRFEKLQLQYEPFENLSLIIDHYQELYADRTPHVKKKDYAALTNLCLQLQTTGNAFGRAVRLPNGDLLACDIFLKDERRIYYLLSATLPNGRTLKANHFLMDSLIKEFAGTDMLLDFEGSDIPGVERFNQKWGSNNQAYFFCKWNNLPWPLRLFKK